MFVMACRWKHGKDVNGLAAEKLRDGDIKPDQVLDFKKKIQAKNLIGLKESCGKIVAKGKRKSANNQRIPVLTINTTRTTNKE